MTATGIIFVNRRRWWQWRSKPQIVRYVQGETASFSHHVQPGETLLITREDVCTDALPDALKAMGVLRRALSARTRTILW